MSTLLKMQKIHPLCSRCIRMYPLQNRWTVLRYLQCYENFSECCTHLILPETALFSPTPTFAKEPICLGALKTTETVYHISLEFDYGSGLIISDYDMLTENDFLVDMNQILLRAKCDFGKKKCTAEVTESSIDSISVGDKITFHLADELPDWAEEIEKVNRKACEGNEEMSTTVNIEK